MQHTLPETNSRQGKGGPKTAAGKARSALNAVTHGLTARAPVALWFETEEAWATFRQGIVASLAPVGEGEKDLAEKIALTLWRQNRVAAYETHRTNLALRATPGEVERDLRPDHTEADAQARFLAKLTERLLLGDLELLKLQRYESHLGRELSRLFKHLHQLQDRRRADHRDPTPATTPVALTVHELPAGTAPPPSAQPSSAPAPTLSSAPAAPPPRHLSSTFIPPTRTDHPFAALPAASHPFLQNELPHPPSQPRSAIPTPVPGHPERSTALYRMTGDRRGPGVPTPEHLNT